MGDDVVALGGTRAAAAEAWRVGKDTIPPRAGCCCGWCVPEIAEPDWFDPVELTELDAIVLVEEGVEWTREEDAVAATSVEFDDCPVVVAAGGVVVVADEALGGGIERSKACVATILVRSWSGWTPEATPLL